MESTLAESRSLSGLKLIHWRLTVLLIVLVPLAGGVWGAVLFWNAPITLTDVAVFVVGYLVTGLGITVGFHRLLTHRSFAAPRAIRLLFAVLGSMAVQGPIIRWVADHRRHHQHSDRDGDPHSPWGEREHTLAGLIAGLWYSHVGWFFDAEKTRASRYAPDLIEDPDIRMVDSWYGLWLALSLLLPAIACFLAEGSIGAVKGLLIGGCLRVFAVQHVTWSVNSICHMFGSRKWKTDDESRNNPVMALLALGEGWHNNHHAFPWSARHGLAASEFDLSYLVIRCLEMAGLAQSVRRPTAEQIGRASRAGDGDESSAHE